MNDQQQPRRYYEVWFDDTDPRSMFSQEEDLRGIDRWIIYKGARISDWPEEVTFYVRGERAEDYLFSALPGWVLVSERVREAFEDCEIKGVQFLPVNVRHKENGSSVGTYWILNVVDVIEALDWERTRWLHPERKFDDEHPILDVVSIALDLDAVRGADIFRLKVKSDVTTGVYISERLKTCLDAANATSGFKFIGIPAYTRDSDHTQHMG